MDIQIRNFVKRPIAYETIGAHWVEMVADCHEIDTFLGLSVPAITTDDIVYCLMLAGF